LAGRERKPPAARGKLFAKSFPLDPLQKLFKGGRVESNMTVLQENRKKMRE
jgi:hypothetical protein